MYLRSLAGTRGKNNDRGIMESLSPLYLLLSRKRPTVSVIFLNIFYCFGQIFSVIVLFSFNLIFVCIVLDESICFEQKRADRIHIQWYRIGNEMHISVMHFRKRMKRFL